MPQNNSNTPNNNLPNKTVKVAGYAKRVFFNDNIEYRNFSPDVVGFAVDEGGTTLFTNGNFSISTNLDPKPDVVFKQGAKSKYFTLDDIEDDSDETKILKNIKTKLNLDLSNPLSYIWYGSTSEFVKASLENIFINWPAAIYVDNKFGAISGDNITNYVYDSTKDQSTFNISTNYLSNPYSIKYSKSDEIVGTEKEVNPLRNFTLEYKSYIIENGNIKRKIINITPPVQSTNDILKLTVEGNPFPQLTGIIIPQYTIFSPPQNGSIPFLIKPNDTKVTTFFSGLNPLQNNLLNRDNYPNYKSIIISPKISDQGVVITTKETLSFPILDDGYNLNFFDSYYLEYLDKLNIVGENYDKTQTDLIVRKYTAEVINSFDTVPRGDGNDLVLNGEKATKLLRIYGVSFDEVKKFINGIKFAHVVTYNKKNNIPDTLVKELCMMLGLDPVTFVTTNKLNETLIPINGQGEFSGTSKSLSNSEVDIELYRRLILNLAWLWKSKGSRKAIEFLFRFIGAPEALVKFNEYIVIADKPLDMDKLKDLLFLYTGEVDTKFIPYDDNGFPNPPKSGSIVPINFDVFTGTTTGTTPTPIFKELWFQKAGGWYRETLGSNTQTILNGNNPHVGKYDGGNEYLDYFQQCYVPGFSSSTNVDIIEFTNKINHFINYNYGIFNGMPSGSTEFYTIETVFNPKKSVYDDIEECYNINYSLIESPLPNDGIYPLEEKYIRLEKEYNAFLKQIKESPYLRYSPEFIKKKNEFLEAKKQYETQVNSENCEGNKALEICLNTLEVEKSIPDCCDDLEIDYKEPYFLISEIINGKKNRVTGERFKCCCEKQEINGEKGRYVNYIPAKGETIVEYCSVTSPCDSEVSGVRPDGTVEFMNNSSNNQPTHQLSDGNFYEFNDDKVCNDRLRKFILSIFPSSNGTTGNLTEDIILYGNELLETNSSTEFRECFTQTNNDNTTIYSSSECCAWNGYSSRIVRVTEGERLVEYIVCVDTSVSVDMSSNMASNESSINRIDEEISFNRRNTTKIEEDLKNDRLTSTEREELLIEKAQTQENIKTLETEKGTIIKQQSLNTQPNIEVTYNEYEPFTNRNATVDNTVSVNRNKELFNEASIVRTIPNSKNSDVELYSTFEDGDLSDTKNWEVEHIDELGRVSFSAIDKDNNKQILDWNNSKGEGNELYAKVGKDKGYVYDTFEVDYSRNKLQQLESNSSLKPHKPTIISVVDTNKIPCDDVKKPNILFGSENYLGFKLPTDEGCECDVEINLDYMLKYNSNKLYECTGNLCNIGFINRLTLNGFNCRNFLVFTHDQEDATILENNITIENQNENIDIWENTTQLEPVKECCDSLGGQIINSEQPQWVEVNSQWTYEIRQQIENPENYDLSNILIKDINYNNKLIEEWKKLKSELSQCLTINYPNIDESCEINVNDYVTTNKVCALKLPTECGVYTYLNKELTITKTEIDFSIIKLEECIEIENNKNELVDIINEEIINEETKKSKIRKTSEIEVEKVNEEILVIESRISKDNQKIETKRSDNNVIDNAISGVDPIKDCSIYQQVINELTTFNIKEFCSSSNNIEECSKTKSEEINKQIKTYSDLLNLCLNNNILNEELETATFKNDKTQIEYLNSEINKNEETINSLLNGPNGAIENNISLQITSSQEENKIFIINKTAELLNVDSSDIVDSNGDLKLSRKQQTDLNILKSTNISEINKLLSNVSELEESKKEKIESRKQIEKETIRQTAVVEEDILVKKTIKDSKGFSGEGTESCCKTILKNIQKFNTVVLEEKTGIEEKNQSSYDKWSKSLYSINEDLNYQNGNTYLSYMDDLKVNFNLFVKQDNGNTTKLPYTNNINPVWEWGDPSNMEYSGIIISEDENANIEQDIIYNLTQNNIQPSSTLFDPKWQNINFSLPNCVCENLRLLYPNGEFYFGLEIENLECDFCIIVDNIEVNITDCNTQKEITLTNCLTPELSCVIDNKKSWVYNVGGIEYQTIYPDGECNTGSTNNFEVTKLVQPEERLWKELEYRYTDYDNPHSDLIMNTKSTVFAIDPANAIECDVYNFWKNIDCEECPTSCDLTCYILGDNGNFLITEDNCSLLVWCNIESDVIKYSGVLRETPSEPLSGYSITLTGCSSDDFNYNDYTNFLEYKLEEMKNEFYSLTGEYNNALNSNYYQFKDKGGVIENFGITKNNCGSDTIVMGNFKDINEKFGLLVEDINGHISLFEVNVFDELSPSLSGVTIEILPGYSAQTFNQSEYLDQEFCEKINFTLNTEGKEGFGLGKNYIWREEYSACTWTDINNGEGDCTYCGTKEVIDRRACLPICPEGYELEHIICPDGLSFNSETNMCEEDDYEQCPEGYEYDELDGDCREKGYKPCDEGYVYNTHSGNCVKEDYQKCPDTHEFIEDNISKEVTYYMPNGLGGEGNGSQWHGDYQSEESPNRRSNGGEPFSFKGFYPLYRTEEASDNASPNNSGSHSHSFTEIIEGGYCRKTEIVCDDGFTMIGAGDSQYCEKIEVADAIEEIPDPTIDCGVTNDAPSGGGTAANGQLDGELVFYKNLGTDMGEVVLEFNAAGLPDRFTVEWDGQVVIDTGYVGRHISSWNTNTPLELPEWHGKTYDSSVNSNETYLDGLEIPRQSYPTTPEQLFTEQPGFDGEPNQQGTPQNITVHLKNGIFDLQGGVHPYYDDASLVERYNSVNGTNLTVDDLSGTNRGIDLGPMSGETGWSPSVYYYGPYNDSHNPELYGQSFGHQGVGTAAFIKDKKVGQKYINTDAFDGADDKEYDVKITVASASVVGPIQNTGWKFQLRCVEPVQGITEEETVPGFYCEDDTFTVEDDNGTPICRKITTATTQTDINDIDINPAPTTNARVMLVEESNEMIKESPTVSECGVCQKTIDITKSLMAEIEVFETKHKSNNNCPEGFVYNPQTEMCDEEGWERICPENYSYNEETNLCEDDNYVPCDEGYTLSEDGTECLDDSYTPCPEGYSLSEDGTECLDDSHTICDENYTFNEDTGMCEYDFYEYCPDGFTYNVETEMCEEDDYEQCPEGFIYDAYWQDCREDPYDPCPFDGFVLSNNGLECVQEDYSGPCPDGFFLNTSLDPVMCQEEGHTPCPENYSYNPVTDKCEDDLWVQCPTVDGVEYHYDASLDMCIETNWEPCPPNNIDTGTIDCNAGPAEAGGPEGDVVTYDLGSELGEVVLEFNSGTLHDRWIVEWDGNVVIDTEWVGDKDFVSLEQSGGYADDNINTFGECLIANGDLDDGSQFYKVDMGVHPKYTDQKVIDRYNEANGTTLTVSNLSGTNTGILNNDDMTWGNSGDINPGGGTASFIKDKAVGEVTVTSMGSNTNCGTTGWKYKLRCVEPMCLPHITPPPFYALQYPGQTQCCDVNYEPCPCDYNQVGDTCYKAIDVQSCESGFTLVGEGSEAICEKITEQDPIIDDSVSTNVNIVKGNDSNYYSEYGGQFWDELIDPDVNPIGINVTTGNFNEQYPIPKTANETQSNFWTKILSPNDKITSTDNNIGVVKGTGVGIWGDGNTDDATDHPLGVGTDPTKAWYGFTHCIDILETKKYVIGLAADNFTKFSIGSKDYVAFYKNDSGSSVTFNRWWMFEVELTAGSHIISMEGRNYSSVACFGAVIYDTDMNSLKQWDANMKTAEDSNNETTKNILYGEMNQYVIFSTKDKIGDSFDLGSGASCDEDNGFVLSGCDGSAKCIKRETSDVITTEQILSQPINVQDCIDAIERLEQDPITQLTQDTTDPELREPIIESTRPVQDQIIIDSVEQIVVEPNTLTVQVPNVLIPLPLEEMETRTPYIINTISADTFETVSVIGEPCPEGLVKVYEDDFGYYSQRSGSENRATCRRIEYKCPTSPFGDNQTPIITGNEDDFFSLGSPTYNNPNPKLCTFTKEVTLTRERLNPYVEEERIVCPIGFTYNSATTMCETSNFQQCPDNYTYNSGTTMCEENGFKNCDDGYTFDGVECLQDEYEKCDSGFTFDENTQKCLQDEYEKCDSGFTFNEYTNQCEEEDWGGMCNDPEYVYDNNLNKCVKTEIGCADSTFDLVGINGEESCQKITEQDAIENSNSNNLPLIVAGPSLTSNYGVNGARAYPTTLSKDTPLTWNTQGQLNNAKSVSTLLTNDFWKRSFDPSFNTPQYPTGGSGIWTDERSTDSVGSTHWEPRNKWIGFNQCIEIQQSKKYVIGMAADNYIRFKVNGDVFITINKASTDVFKNWWLFEISLEAGTHTISLEGKNQSKSAIFGCVIYDSDMNTLVNSVTTETELENLIIFNSKDKIGESFDISEDSNFVKYSCPSGFLLSNCGDNPVCTKIERADAINIITQEDPTPQLIQTPNNQPELNPNIQPRFSANTQNIVLPEVLEVVSATTTNCGIASATTVNVCINPKDYLDVDPETINTKDRFDDLILSNLIDAKSRQVISDYPMLKLFYQLYLNANDCGKDLSGKLTYNDLFNFMDKIGDYWLDLLEQVVPATTIWEGCDNSGKLYRNTIFDQNKYKYRRYVLNYNDSEDCALSGISENVIASAHTDVVVIENSLHPTDNNIIKLQNEINDLKVQKENFLNKQNIIEITLCSLKLEDSTPKTEEEIEKLTRELIDIESIITEISNNINNLIEEIKQAQTQLSISQEQFQNEILNSCKSISDSLVMAEKDLNDLYEPFTTSYEKQRDYIAGLKDKYKKCISKTKTQISNYDTIFITQMYDSNEYEGNVTIIGDEEWEEGGPFYNNSLIYDCTTQYFDNRA